MEVPVDEPREPVVVLDGPAAAAAAHVEAALGEAEVALDVDQQQTDVARVGPGGGDPMLGAVEPRVIEERGGVRAIRETGRVSGIVERGHGQLGHGGHATSLSLGTPACQRRRPPSRLGTSATALRSAFAFFIRVRRADGSVEAQSLRDSILRPKGPSFVSFREH